MVKVASLTWAAVLALGLAAQQKDCDMATQEPGKWCPKCAKLLDPTDIEKGKCKADQSPLKNVAVCVKKDFACGCGGGCCTVHSGKPGNCKCGKPLKAGDASKCVIGYKCTVCDAFAVTQEDVKHDDDKHKEKKSKACKKVCELSGTGLHVRG